MQSFLFFFCFFREVRNLRSEIAKVSLTLKCFLLANLLLIHGKICSLSSVANFRMNKRKKFQLLAFDSCGRRDCFNFTDFAIEAARREIQH